MILDPGSVSHSVKDEAVAMMDEGLSPTEIIPGLVLAIRELANQTTNPEVALDEAMDMLAEPADGGEEM